VSIMASVCFILDVARVDGNSTSLFFWGFINVLIVKLLCKSTKRDD